MKKKNRSLSSSPYFGLMLELRFHNPNWTIPKAKNNLDFPTI
jgi:hypothetical protein